MSVESTGLSHTRAGRQDGVKIAPTALDSTTHGPMLVLFSIYMPTGILGKPSERSKHRAASAG